MAGNSQRKGAMRNAGSKKGPQVGSGGQRRKQLKGRGPTPKAEDRPHHPARRRANAAVKRAAATRTRRPSERRDTETLVGRNPVVEALRAGVPATLLEVQLNIELDERVREAIRLATERGIPLLEVTKGELDRITAGSVHQGLALKVPPYEYFDADELLKEALASGDAPLFIALDGVTDARNLGAIARSAAAFGAHGVIVPERRSAGVNAGAWKTSAGTLARVPVAQVTNLTRAITAFQDAGCLAIGLAADGDFELDAMPEGILDGPLLIVIGSEGKGLARLVRETCDYIVSIPMSGLAESLNAGVAGGISLYAAAAARRNS